MRQKSLGAFNIFVQGKKLGYFTFYGAQYINLVKSYHSTEKLCIIASLQPKFCTVILGLEWKSKTYTFAIGPSKSQSHSTQYLFNPERVHKVIWWCFLLQKGAQKRHPTQKILIPSYKKPWITLSINTETLSKGAWLLRTTEVWALGSNQNFSWTEENHSLYCVLRCLLVMKRKSDIPRTKYVTN